jgi:hypothetical protein
MLAVVVARSRVGIVTAPVGASVAPDVVAAVADGVVAPTVIGPPR